MNGEQSPMMNRLKWVFNDVFIRAPSHPPGRFGFGGRDAAPFFKGNVRRGNVQAETRQKENGVFSFSCPGENKIEFSAPKGKGFCACHGQRNKQ